uniref:DDE_Tnp_IS1595 domain-containing protein n=1 Tax=Caenorhabditis japonica TaxID=281687 RepID=A0A8R1I3W7_CAEJA
MQLGDIKSLNDITTHFPTEKDVVHLFMDCNLLKKEAKCEKCGKQMALRSRGSSYEWRCRLSKSKDCSSKTIKTGSFFQNTKLTLTQALKVMVMWIQKYSSGQISAEVGISQQTVCDWRNFLRELCVEIEKDYEKIGGQNHICEIDETNVHCRKYGVGKGLKEDWVLGGIDRENGRVFAQRVPNRTASTLVPLLQTKIEKNSIVYSDEWKSYSQLKKYFAGHYTVQHKTQFVNLIGSRAVCTNGIESLWSRLKKPFKISNGTSSALLDSYISEFVVRENEKDEFYTKVLEKLQGIL